MVNITILIQGIEEISKTSIIIFIYLTCNLNYIRDGLNKSVESIVYVLEL